MKWLKENFDVKGYSIMTCVYKYNDENTVDWLTSNKIHSYVQRLDEVRKYAFGTMNVIDRKATKGYYEVCVRIFQNVLTHSNLPYSRYSTYLYVYIE